MDRSRELFSHKRERGWSDDNDARALFLSSAAGERVELLWIASTYLVGMNESGNQKGDLSYLVITKWCAKILPQRLKRKEKGKR